LTAPWAMGTPGILAKRGSVEASPLRTVQVDTDGGIGAGAATFVDYEERSASAHG
jgi:hypothetical protein